MSRSSIRSRNWVYYGTLIAGLIQGPLGEAQVNLPDAVTLAASGSNGSASLTGNVNPNGLPTMAWFEWGSNLGCSNTTALIDVGSGTAFLPVNAVVTGLNAGAAYDYRICASNSVGLARGQDGILQTPRIVLNGANPMTNECHTHFVDPGASVMAAPFAIGGGNGYSLALNYDGTVVAWGDPGQNEDHVPAGLSNVVAIAAGAFHCLALKEDGGVVGWGDGIWGDTTPPNDLSNTVAVAAGSYYSLALNGNGTVVGWGNNSYGQTNVPSGLSNVVAIAAGSFHALALNSAGKVVGWGYNADGEINIPTDLSNVVAIAAGWNQSLALKSDGTVAGWGQASIPVGLSNVVAIAAGLFHNLALKNDGTVVGWGLDYYGQATGLETLTNVIAIAAGGYHSLAITGDGSLVAVGYNLYGQTSVPSNLGGNLIESGFVDYNNPGNYTLTYAASNSLGGAGTATRTVVVVDTTPPSLTLLGTNPLVMPVNTAFVDPGATAVDACAGDLTSSIYVVGNVNSSVLGSNTLAYSVTDYSGNTTSKNRTVITVAGAPFVSTLTANGSNHNATVSATINPNGGSTMAWFESGTNILHGNRTLPISVSNGLTNVMVSSLLAGLTPGVTYHYRIVATNSAGCSYGRDATFQNLPATIQAPAVMLHGANPLTNECHTPFVDPGAVIIAPLAAIAAGENYSLALKTDGTVAAWGNAANVPPGLNNVKAVAAGYIHCLALKSDGTVAGWGDSSFGETNPPAGLSNVVAISSGWGFSLALHGDGFVTAWGLGATNPPTYDGLTFGQAMVPKGLSNVVAIAAGFDSSLALKSDGTVVSWGYPEPYYGWPYTNYAGAVPPNNLSNVIAIAAGGDFGLALKTDGKVVGWGYGAEGQTSVPAGLSNVVAIAAGFYHSLALKSDGTVVGWGDDFYGEATPPPNLKDVIAISAGAYHSLALKKDGTVIGWGVGLYGETDITTSGTNLVTSVVAKGYVDANDPGRYTLTYKATNATGQVSAITRTVIVVDTTPPIIDCPTNITIEFATEKGAEVFFTPQATDLCSSYVNVRCTPPSGSWFPIGTTTVNCKAKDFSRNTASCSFQVTVLGAQGVKSNLVTELTAWLGKVTNAYDHGNISGAISNLQQSLVPALWIDQTHLDRTNGVMDFKAERTAVQCLMTLLPNSHNTIPNATLQQDIKRVTKSDYLLALIAIENAQTAWPPRKLSEATSYLVRGNTEAVRSRYDLAIGYYQTAWSLATRQINTRAK